MILFFFFGLLLFFLLLLAGSQSCGLLLGSFLFRRVVRRNGELREFHADAGAADIMGSTTPMINALQRLGGIAPNELPGNVKGFGISGGIGSLFASHPSIEDRVAALREHRYTNAQ